MHPDEVLYRETSRHPRLPVCDHYCGRLELLAKSLALQARLGPVLDVTADCEDGAPVGREIDHITRIAEVIDSSANPFDRVGVRPHPVGHAVFEQELTILFGRAGRRVPFLTLPKIDSLRQVEQAEQICRHLEARFGLARPIPFQVLIESPGALATLPAIAAHPRVQALCFGLMDYVSSFEGAVGAEALHDARQFEHPLLNRALTDISLAAHAHGKVAVHGVTLQIGDGQAAGRDALRAARDFGFERKWSIHPAQVLPIIAAFRPSHDEIRRAADILLAAQRADWGPIRFGDQLHDRASYRYWWRVLQRAEHTGADLDADIRAAFFSA
ncbi:MAG: aldolase/citrate lyase family protein [Lautropia sp.]|nr:aldolase/citrate lyase family protein [Lautropia sp.]